MKQFSKETTKRVWLSALLLFVCVAATAAALISILNSFQMDAEGAIELESETATVTKKDIETTQDVPTVDVPAAPVTTPAPQSSTPAPQASTPPKSTGSIGMESSDEDLIWSTETKVELFRTSYENDAGEVTVLSNNGDKVIAPGTKNSYTFKLRNTGAAALDYTVDVSAFFTSTNEDIPMEVRISRYDGKWIVGDEESFIPVEELEHIEDSATLERGKFTYYTLEWYWPFESGGNGDAIDTALGQVTVTQNLSFSLLIETTAERSTNPTPPGPGYGGGLDVPKTGDEFNAVLWAALAMGAGVNLIILLFFKWREDRDKEAKQS